MLIAPILQPFLIGVLSGFITSVPVGPINVTIVNEGARMGFRSAFFVGIGAVTMEVLYCMIAFTGFASLFDSRLIRTLMELMSFLLLSILGLKYLLARQVKVKVLAANYLEEKLHLQAAFMIGFLRILLNPVVLLFWITMATTVISHELVSIQFTSKSFYIAGVAVGCLGWFWFLAYEVAKRRQKFSHKTLLTISRVSGVLLVILAILIGRTLAMDLINLS
ncbi:MAG: LysE family translocator [Limisphaerales bacterium]|jgi:L-lysine exporter family protein LysE/ArgO|nr:LysE family transporter [Verrucomicrobiota bacterium]